MTKTIRIIGSYTLLAAAIYLALIVLAVVGGGGVVDPGNPPEVYQYGHFTINKGSYIFILLSAALSCISIYMLWPYRRTNKVFMATHYFLVSYSVAALIAGGMFYVLANVLGDTYA